MTIARVFPRRTEATPTDKLAFIGECPDPKVVAQLIPDLGEVHVSCAFTYDLSEAERIAESWRALDVPVLLGGPALGKPSGPCSPGVYVKECITFTSRGCNNHCWFCRVPKVEGKLREYPIVDGYIINDDNLLACSESHVRNVFKMLARQQQKPEFKGGLEAKILKPWHVDLLVKSKPARIYMAYDTPDDYEPLVMAGRMLQEAGIKRSRHILSAYVLIGYKGDTLEKALDRCVKTWLAGFVPYAMLYTDEEGKTKDDYDHTDCWGPFQRQFLRPEISMSILKKLEAQ